MYSIKYLGAVILICCASISFAQNRNSVWCFGDSSGIDFINLSSPIPIHSAEKTRGSCASICDSLGNLLFYSGYNPQALWGGSVDYNGEIYNWNHTLMQNGDLIITEAWYQEQVIIPMPNSAYKFYLFSVNVTGGLGLYYSIINITQDSGRGAVIQKNIQLQNYYAADCIQAIKHGNGRDWWVLSRASGSASNDFYEYLISPAGLSNPIIQSVGTLTSTNGYKLVFSKDGTRMAVITLAGLIELYDFNRCTGDITLNQTIASESTSAPFPEYWGVAFSPNNQFLYVSKQSDDAPLYPSNLIQFDLNSPNIFASADTIWSYDSVGAIGGLLKLAPDNKIYLACAWNDGVHFNYPYPDTAFNQINNNLSVINYPDSPGVACGFAPFSFNLGAGRCYWGLPNNPDYELGAVANSFCDTVTAVSAVGSSSRQEELHVFYHLGWQIAFLNAEGLKGKRFNLQVFDLFGRVIYHDEGSLNSEYYTKDLNCDGFAKGMYIVTLQTGPVGQGEKLVKRFIKQ